MNTQKVSIIVPIYGVEKYIERCARSLFEQTYNNLEFIFVNDCTKDKSIEILKTIIQDYPTRQNFVEIISHDHNRGLAASRNTGVSECSGDYLMHVDSDDWLELNAVELLIDSVANNDIDIISFGYILEKRNRSEMSKFINNKKAIINGILTNKLHASIWSKMYKTSFYKNSGIASIEGLNQGEDYVLVPRLLHKATNVIFINKHLYHYEMTNQSSYTKNVRCDAIQNIHDADDILYTYFSRANDNNKYKQALEVLHVRSMLYLLKTSNWTIYNDILSIYNYGKISDFNSLSFLDKLILWLANMGFYRITFYLIKLGFKILK